MELFSTKAGSFDDQILLDGIETVGGDIAKSSGGVIGISKSSCGNVGGSVKGVKLVSTQAAPRREGQRQNG